MSTPETSSHFDVRFVGPEHHADATLGIVTTLGLNPSPEHLARMRALDENELRICTYDAHAPVGGMLSFAFEMTVPGARLATSGLSAVGVLPTHRRRGILTSMMRAYVDNLAARGVPLSALWAADGAIYRRFGYGPSTSGYAVRAPRSHRAFVAAARVRPAFTLLDEEQALARIPPVYERARARRNGTLSRSRSWWHVRRLGEPVTQPASMGRLQRVVAQVDGRDEGYAIYRIEGQTTHLLMGGAVHVIECTATEPAIEQALWEYLFSIDLMDAVVCEHIAVDHPLLTGQVEPRRLRATLCDELWLRLIDVERALSLRSYAAEASLRITVRDAFRPENAGTFRVDPGREPRVTRVQGTGELALDISTLGMAYLGGHTFAALADAGLVEVRENDALARADALFRTPRAPFCGDFF